MGGAEAAEGIGQLDQYLPWCGSQLMEQLMQKFSRLHIRGRELAMQPDSRP